jgi:hypothetical protein
VLLLEHVTEQHQQWTKQTAFGGVQSACHKHRTLEPSLSYSYASLPLRMIVKKLRRWMWTGWNQPPPDSSFHSSQLFWDTFCSRPGCRWVGESSQHLPCTHGTAGGTSARQPHTPGQTVQVRSSKLCIKGDVEEQWATRIETL